MTLPGVEVLTEDARGPRGPRLTLATPFLVGELRRGLPQPIPVRSLRDLVRACGERTNDTAPMHDWLDAYFRAGGGLAYVTPLRGPDAEFASLELDDVSSAVGITVTAKSPGTWGNGAAGGLSVDVDASGGNFTLKVYLGGTLVEQATDLADGAAAAAWSTGSQYVTVTDGPGGDPVATVSAQNLTGGDDDFDGITTTEITAALDVFTADLGPGSIVLPGRTTTAVQLVAAQAAEDRNRILKADAPATADVATLVAHAATLRAGGNGDRIDLLAPRVVIPGLTGNTTRTVPASAMRCAAEARNDRDGISPNQPAAGRWGLAEYATAPTVVWSDAGDLADLNAAGVNVIRVVDGDLKLYGARTVADGDEYPAALRLGSARLRMAIVEIARFQAEQVTFTEIDEGGVVLGELAGVIEAGVNRYERSLYDLQVNAELVEDTPGVYLVEVEVEFQAAPDAERVRVIITRAVTEV